MSLNCGLSEDDGTESSLAQTIWRQSLNGDPHNNLSPSTFYSTITDESEDPTESTYDEAHENETSIFNSSKPLPEAPTEEKNHEIVPNSMIVQQAQYPCPCEAKNNEMMHDSMMTYQEQYPYLCGEESEMVDDSIILVKPRYPREWYNKPLEPPRISLSAPPVIGPSPFSPSRTNYPPSTSSGNQDSTSACSPSVVNRVCRNIIAKQARRVPPIFSTIRQTKRKAAPVRRTNRTNNTIDILKQGTNLAIPRLPFGRVVREVCDEVCNKMDIEPKRWQSLALEALQVSTECYLECLFMDSHIVALHANRKKLMPSDIHLALQIRGDDDPGKPIK